MTRPSLQAHHAVTGYYKRATLPPVGSLSTCHMQPTSESLLNSTLACAVVGWPGAQTLAGTGIRQPGREPPGNHAIRRGCGFGTQISAPCWLPAAHAVRMSTSSYLMHVRASVYMTVMMQADGHNCTLIFSALACVQVALRTQFLVNALAATTPASLPHLEVATLLVPENKCGELWARQLWC